MNTICEAYVVGMLSNPRQGSEGLELAFFAEAMGAVSDDTRIAILYDILGRNPLMDAEAHATIQGLAGLVGDARRNGSSAYDISSMLGVQMYGIIDMAPRSEERGINKDPLKLAVQAFYAGATIQVPKAAGTEHFIEFAATLSADRQ